VPLVQIPALALNVSVSAGIFQSSACNRGRLVQTPLQNLSLKRAYFSRVFQEREPIFLPCMPEKEVTSYLPIINYYYF
jgi:hypothetical protein